MFCTIITPKALLVYKYLLFVSLASRPKGHVKPHNSQSALRVKEKKELSLRSLSLSLSSSPFVGLASPSIYIYI